VRSLGEPRDGVVARIVAVATQPAHIKLPIIEVPSRAPGSLPER
jgi:hypothetical protein